MSTEGNEFESARVEVRMKDGQVKVVEFRADDQYPLTGSMDFETDKVEKPSTGAWREFEAGPTHGTLQLSGRIALPRYPMTDAPR